VPAIGPHAQDRLGLVDDDQHALVLRSLGDRQDAAQVRQRVGATDIALEIGASLHRGGDVLATRDPGDERGRVRQLALLLEVEDRLDHANEVGWRLAAGEVGELLAHLLAHLLIEALGIGIAATLDQPVLDLADPAIEDVAQRAAGAALRGQLRHHLAIDLLEAVESQVIVGYHHETGREAACVGLGDREPSDEGLAAAVTAAQKFDPTAALLHQLELTAQLVARFVHAHGECVEPALRHQPAAQLVEDVFCVVLGQHHSSPRT